MGMDEKKKEKINIRGLFSSNITLLIIVLAVVCTAFSIASPYFMTLSNLKNIGIQSSVYGLLTIGVTFVIISGGIDLSVGSIIGLCGAVLASLVRSEVGVFFALIVTMMLGMAMGAVNGSVITFTGVPPFIATLGTLNIFRGVTFLFTKASPITGVGQFLMTLGSGDFLGIPISFMVCLVFYAMAFYVLKYTKMGRYIYVIGGNKEAARLSGIKVKKNIFSTYVISGLMASIAGIVMTGKVNTAQPLGGEGYELDAVAAAVIGGISMIGGEGNVIGTLFGVILITVLRNGMSMVHINTYWQKILLGIVMIGAVMFDTLRHKKRN